MSATRLCTDEWLCVVGFLHLSEINGVLSRVNRRLRDLSRDPRCYRRLHFLARTSDAVVRALLHSGRVSGPGVRQLALLRCHQLGVEGMRDLCNLFRPDATNADTHADADTDADAEADTAARAPDASASAVTDPMSGTAQQTQCPPVSEGASALAAVVAASPPPDPSPPAPPPSALLHQAAVSVQNTVSGLMQAVRHATTTSDVGRAVSTVATAPRDMAHIVAATLTASKSAAAAASTRAPSRVALESLTFEGCSQLFEQEDEDEPEPEPDGESSGQSDDGDDGHESAPAAASLLHEGAVRVGLRPRPHNSFSYVAELIRLVSPSLRSFSLRFVQPASWGDFQLNLRSCAQLRRLQVIGVSPFEPFLRGLRASLVTQLRDLSLSDHNLLDGDLLILLQHNPHLRSVHITSRTHLDLSLAHMLCSMPHLTSVDLSLCYAIADQNMEAVRRAWDDIKEPKPQGPKLRRLRLDHSAIGAMTVPYLTLPSHQLRMLEEEQKQQEEEGGPSARLAAQAHQADGQPLEQQRQPAAFRVQPWMRSLPGGSRSVKRMRHAESDADALPPALALPWSPSGGLPQLTSLEILTVHSCTCFDDRSLSLVAQASAALTHVDVSFTSVSSVSVQLLVAKHAPSLTRLSLCGCQRLSGDALRAISTSCRSRLRWLDLSNVFALDKTDLRVLFLPLPDALHEGARHGLQDDGSAAAGRDGREAQNSWQLSCWHQLESLLLDGIAGLDDDVLCWLVEGVLDSRAHAQHTTRNPHARALDVHTDVASSGSGDGVSVAAGSGSALRSLDSPSPCVRRRPPPVLCPRLELLSVRASTWLSDDGIRLLRVGYPRLQLCL